MQNLASGKEVWGILKDHIDAYSSWLLSTVLGFHTQNPLEVWALTTTALGS